jgi:hypothetical protein
LRIGCLPRHYIFMLVSPIRFLLLVQGNFGVVCILPSPSQTPWNLSSALPQKFFFIDDVKSRKLLRNSCVYLISHWYSVYCYTISLLFLPRDVRVFPKSSQGWGRWKRRQSVKSFFCRDYQSYNKFSLRISKGFISDSVIEQHFIP